MGRAIHGSTSERLDDDLAFGLAGFDERVGGADVLGVDRAQHFTERGADSAAQALRNALAPIGAAGCDQACYRLEHQRCKVAAGDR